MQFAATHIANEDGQAPQIDPLSAQTKDQEQLIESPVQLPDEQQYQQQQILDDILIEEDADIPQRGLEPVKQPPNALIQPDVERQTLFTLQDTIRDSFPFSEGIQADSDVKIFTSPFSRSDAGGLGAFLLHDLALDMIRESNLKMEGVLLYGRCDMRAKDCISRLVVPAIRAQNADLSEERIEETKVVQAAKILQKQIAKSVREQIINLVVVSLAAFVIFIFMANNTDSERNGVAARLQNDAVRIKKFQEQQKVVLALTFLALLAFVIGNLLQVLGVSRCKFYVFYNPYYYYSIFASCVVLSVFTAVDNYLQTKREARLQLGLVSFSAIIYFFSSIRIAYSKSTQYSRLLRFLVILSQLDASALLKGGEVNVMESQS